MIDARLTAMGAAALCLCGVIGVELAGGGQSQPDIATIRAVPAAPGGDAAAVADPPGQRDGQLAAILARPLFSPDRRPAAGAARSISGLPRLTGIVVTGSRKLAIFAGPGKPMVAEQGMRLGAYEVTAISDAGVTVAGPEGTSVLRPIFDPSPPPVTKAAVFQRPEPPRPAAK
nr:hypothetical protein [uncultured Rhodopila sp.]